VQLGLKKTVCGAEENHLRTFRHTFASRLVQHGAEIVTVKELLGHSTIVVTMRYAHSNDESKRRAVAKLSASDSDKIVTIVKNRAS
jgi:site-specific recombinase XerD